MFLFAHEGYTILFAEIISLIYYFLWFKKRSKSTEDKWGINYFSIFAILFGAMGPDLIDKILIQPFTGFGRHIGHSLLFNLLISIAVFLVFRKRKRVYLGFILGWQMHILLDVGGFIPWFYPFIQYEFQPRILSFWEMLSQPTVYINEIIGLLCLTAILLLYLKRKVQIKNILFNDLKKDFSIK